MRKIRKGDEVIVLTGKDKGKRGAVLRVCWLMAMWWLRVSTWLRSRSRIWFGGVAGGIVEIAKAIDVSNVDF